MGRANGGTDGLRENRRLPNAGLLWRWRERFLACFIAL